MYEMVLPADATLEVRAPCVVLDLGTADPRVVSLALTLLAEALVEGLALRDTKGAWGARIRASGEAHGARVRHYHQDRLEISLGRTELRLWQLFFLRYARDGAPEVDHLDLDATWGQGSPAQLVLRVSRA